MIKRGKKGQGVFGMSFTVIFSIILIIAIVAVAFFAIGKFLDLNKCAQSGLYFNDLQDEIDRAWNSNLYRGFFEEKPPAEIEFICFGDLTVDVIGGPSSENFKRREAFIDAGYNEENNVFLYKPGTACISTKKVDHVIIKDFFCVENDKPRVKLEIKISESLVTISQG